MATLSQFSGRNGGRIGNRNREPEVQTMGYYSMSSFPDDSVICGNGSSGMEKLYVSRPNAEPRLSFHNCRGCKLCITDWQPEKANSAQAQNTNAYFWRDIGVLRVFEGDVE